MGPRRYPAAGGISLRRPAGRIIPAAGDDGYHNAVPGDCYAITDANPNRCADADFYPDAGANANRYTDAVAIPNPIADAGTDGHTDARPHRNPHPHAVARCPPGTYRQRRLCR